MNKNLEKKVHDLLLPLDKTDLIDFIKDYNKKHAKKISDYSSNLLNKYMISNKLLNFFSNNLGRIREIT